jgi:hypothetical protein
MVRRRADSPLGSSADWFPRFGCRLSQSYACLLPGTRAGAGKRLGARPIGGGLVGP